LERVLAPPMVAAAPVRRLRPVHYLLALTAGFVGVPYFALMHVNPLFAAQWRALREAAAGAAADAARSAADAAGVQLPAGAPAAVLRAHAPAPQAKPAVAPTPPRALA